MGRRTLLGLAGAVAASVLFTGCSPGNQGAVTLDPETELPALAIALCDGERADRVRLIDGRVDDWRSDEPAPRAVYWEIRAVDTTVAPTTYFVTGETPEGYVAVTPLNPKRPLPQNLSLFADMSGGLGAYHGDTFNRSDLEIGTLLQFGRSTSLRDLEDVARANCGDASFVEELGFTNRQAAIAVVLVAVLCACLAAAISASVIVRRRRVPREDVQA